MLSFSNVKCSPKNLYNSGDAHLHAPYEHRSSPGMGSSRILTSQPRRHGLSGKEVQKLTQLMNEIYQNFYDLF